MLSTFCFALPDRPQTELDASMEFDASSSSEFQDLTVCAGSPVPVAHAMHVDPPTIAAPSSASAPHLASDVDVQTLTCKCISFKRWLLSRVS